MIRGLDIWSEKREESAGRGIPFGYQARFMHHYNRLYFFIFFYIELYGVDVCILSRCLLGLNLLSFRTSLQIGNAISVTLNNKVSNEVISISIFAKKINIRDVSISDMHKYV